MQPETPEDARNRVSRHASVCFYVSEDLGWGAGLGEAKGGLARAMSLHMPGGMRTLAQRWRMEELSLVQVL